jgi:catechol 2,3-dioxygenase-like lactoylglutathione lyase family enzyme
MDEAPVRAPLLRGVHHLAINTDDLRTTLDFYVRVLGMPLLHGLVTRTGAAARAETRGNPPFDTIPHYFVDMGGDSTLAIFEFPKGKAAKANRNTVGAMQHVSFACTPSRFKEMQDRLVRNGVEIMFGPQAVLPPNIQSIYFFDPNGIRLEISADMSGDDENLDVVRSVLMDKPTMRSELEKISTDPEWIELMLANMLDAEPRYPGAKMPG